MGFLDGAIRKSVASPDSGAQFLVGRVVRLSDDDEISKTRTVSVMTQNGTLFKDVLITFDNRYTKSFPNTPNTEDSLGSLVIIGFLEANQRKPFILKYIWDTSAPVPQQPKNFYEFSNGDFMFSSDGYGNTVLDFINKEDQTLTVRLLSLNSKVKVIVKGVLDINVGEENREVENSFNKIKGYYLHSEERQETTSTKSLEVYEKEYHYSDHLEEKFRLLESEIEELKRRVVTAELKVEESLKIVAEEKAKISVVCKNINLGSDSPSDSAVLYSKLQNILNRLCNSLSTLTVTCSGPGSTSTVPTNAADFISISSSISEMKSKYIKIE